LSPTYQIINNTRLNIANVASETRKIMTAEPSTPRIPVHFFITPLSYPPAIRTIRETKTPQVTYTFHNTFNISVQKISSEEDIREIGRKLAEVLAEEARRMGIEV